MNLGTRLRGGPRNRWQDEVREDAKTVGGEGWQEKVKKVKQSRYRPGLQEVRVPRLHDNSTGWW